jgi:hypothetical protein
MLFLRVTTITAIVLTSLALAGALYSRRRVMCVCVETKGDPWGGTYRMFCGCTLPPGATGIALMSFGEDGTYSTADDVRSW